MKYRMKHAPMGWNSYDYYDTTVTEREVRANADYMAAHLKPYGWEYIVVDIQWYAKNTGSQREKYQYIPFGEVSMDEYGRLLPCTDRFPSAKDGVGFRALADYVHGLGLKFGIHIMRGIPREAAHRHLPILGSDALASDIADPSSICKWNPDMYCTHSGAWILSNAMISAIPICTWNIRIRRRTRLRCCSMRLKSAAGTSCSPCRRDRR